GRSCGEENPVTDRGDQSSAVKRRHDEALQDFTVEVTPHPASPMPTREQQGVNAVQIGISP
ncbi:MAG: hypothetical protein QOD90_2577, partial [Mycobacterium sp.]|nr:hypothetical protein [Mycobacterium sp.]